MYILHMFRCVICNEECASTIVNGPDSCDACSPHVCVPELPEDDWCDICGHDFPANTMEA